MNEWTTYIYLFFMKECCGINSTFYNKVFQFHRFLALEKNTKWERLFWVDEKGVVAKDVDSDNVLRTLIHHELIYSNYTVNDQGEQFLKEMKENHPQVFALLQEFSRKEENGRFKTASCFLEGYSFPIACHLCHERVCVNTQLTIKDFGRLFNIKGLKNPYKKRSYSTPLF